MALTRQYQPDIMGPDDQTSPEYIRAELARILNSAEFKAPLRRREILKYLVEELLAGRADQIKGYTIGVNVLGRDESFDPDADPVVRLEARRLRHDLDSYYVSEGRNNPLRISIPKGRYVPQITLPDVVSAITEDNTANAGAPADGAMVQLRWIVAAALVAVVIITALGYLLIDNWRKGADGDTLENGPALAVLPFEVLSAGEAGSFLAAGIAHQVVRELNRFPYFRIFSPYANIKQSSTLDPVKIGRRLGVSYVVAGSVGSEGSSVSIGARLVDARTGQILWTDTYHRALTPGSLLKVQVQIAAGIASTLGQPYGVITTEITKGLSKEFNSSMPSYECVLRAHSYRRTFSAELHAPVLACLETAVQRDPEYADAWAMLGWLYLDAARYGRTRDGNADRAYDRALDAAAHAVALDGNNVLALKALSSINHYLGNYEEGERLARRALELNPNDPDTLAQLGWRLAVRGNFNEGIPYIKRAISRTVNPPAWYYHLVAIDHYMKGKYAEMLTDAKIGTLAGSPVSWSLVAIAHGALGNQTAARDALDKMAELSPLLGRDPAAAYRLHGTVDSIVDALVAGLRKAGWTKPHCGDNFVEAYWPPNESGQRRSDSLANDNCN